MAGTRGDGIADRERLDMRKAEIATALTLIGLSVVLMVYAVELPIGWIPEQGPGGGAFPFWLSLIILVCSALVLARELAGRGRFSGSLKRFMDDEAVLWVGAVVVLLIVTVGLIHVVGMFIAIPFFLLVYLRWIGHHSWWLTLPLVLLTPIGMFFFFEVALRILLPKGITQPWFAPLYATFM